MYKLTEEGIKYLKEGLPEKRLICLVVSKQKSGAPLSIGKAKKHFSGKEFTIALQWAKKNMWVEISGGKLVSLIGTSEPKKTIEDELRNLSKDQNVASKSVQILITRKLVKEDKDDAWKRAGKLAGRKIDRLNPDLIKTGLWTKVELRPYNVEFSGRKIYPGKRQPYNQFLIEVRQKLVELGFKEMSGPAIETEFWNFDALYQAQNHPSRDWAQTYTLKNPKALGNLPNKKIVNNVKASHENGWKTGSTGWGYRWDPKKAAQLMPRAHTTCLSARTLAGGPEIPGKYFAIARCYRPDVIDATHGIEFNQIEGIVIDPSLTFRELLGLLKMFAIEVAGAEEVKFFPDYYPFTSPSVQLSVKHPKMGWVEFAGAGIFRPELTEPLGVKEPVIAWGLGVDRLAMFKLGINDIRMLFSQNLDWLRKRQVL